MKENNKGFSLLEIIIVISITIILLGAVSLNSGTFSGSKVRECGQKISNQLNSTKTGSMSRFDESMEISYKEGGSMASVTSDGIYTENKSYTVQPTKVNPDPNTQTEAQVNQMAITGSEIRKVGEKKIVVVVTLTDGSEVKIGDGLNNRVLVSYNRTSGAQDAVVVNGTEMPGVYIKTIAATLGNRSSVITMYHKTGKHTLEE